VRAKNYRARKREGADQQDVDKPAETALPMTMLERAIDENTEMATDEKKVLPKKIGTNNSLSRVLDNDEM